MAGPEALQRAPTSLLPVPAKLTRPVAPPPPHLSLAPTWQFNGALPVSGTPMRPSPSSSTSSIGSKSGTSALPGFRSLKNLLPFGSGKTSASSMDGLGARNGSSDQKGSSGGYFGSIRRSMAVERGATAPLRESPPQTHIPRSASLDRGDAVRRTYPDTVFHSSPAVTPKKGKEPDQRLSPGYGVTGGDLSTIIESDTSGISKHIPDTSESEVEGIVDRSWHNSDAENSPHISPSIAITAAAPAPSSRPFTNKSLPPSPTRDTLHPMADLKQTVRRTRSAMDEPDSPLLYVLQAHDDTSPSSGTTSGGSSVLDLSASELKDEVRGAVANTRHFVALSHEAVILDDPSSSKEPSPSPGVPSRAFPIHDSDLNGSFDLEKLDPDLAVLLSPNNARQGESFGSDVKSWTPRTSSPPPRRATQTALATSSSLPRPSSSLGDPPPARSDRDRGSSSSAGSRRVSVDYPRSRPAQPPSPLASEFGEMRAPSSSRISRPRTSGGERTLNDPSREQMHRPPLRAYNSTSTTVDTMHSRTRIGLTSSVNGPTSAGRHLLSPRLDRMNVSDDRSTTPDRTVRVFSPSTSTSSAAFRNRKRSLSAVDPATRPAPEWLGPRTAKAFAEAGLIDPPDRGGDTGRRSSDRARFTPSRASSEREWHSARTAPSRMAFSEVEFGGGSLGSGFRSVSSTGKRSGGRSRGLSASVSERGYPGGGGFVDTTGSSASHGGRSSVFSGRSAGSGSPSTSAWSEVNGQMQILKEKHAAEMEALLSALQDSQRTTKMLRAENEQLRARVTVLEEDLQEAVFELREGPMREEPSPDTPPSMRTRGRIYDVPEIRQPSYFRQQSPVSPLKQSVRGRDATERMQSFTPPEATSPFDELGASPLDGLAPAAESSHFIDREPEHHSGSSSSSVRRRRSSTPSSLFPVLPSNMSMLLNEASNNEDVFDHSDSSGLHASPSPPASPTLVLPPLSGSTSPPVRTQAVRSVEHTRNFAHHIAQKSISSAGNISPTTVDFSIYSMGSPGSLNLRPEHEVHLDDMSAFDLGGDDDSFKE